LKELPNLKWRYLYAYACSTSFIQVSIVRHCAWVQISMYVCGLCVQVMEVVRIMEQEMGLVPGWLWQQHCKVLILNMESYSWFTISVLCVILYTPEPNMEQGRW
jgi:hypothetical protein